MTNTDCLNGKNIKIVIYSGYDHKNAKHIYDYFINREDKEETIKVRTLDHNEVKILIHDIVIKTKEDFLRGSVIYNVEIEGLVIPRTGLLK